MDDNQGLKMLKCNPQKKPFSDTEYTLPSSCAAQYYYVCFYSDGGRPINMQKQPYENLSVEQPVKVGLFSLVSDEKRKEYSS